MTPPTRAHEQTAATPAHGADPVVVDAEEFERAQADSRLREAGEAAEAYLAQLREDGRDR